MSTSTARLGQAGRLVIPADLRRELGIETGDELILRLDAEGLHVSTPAQALARAQEFVKSLRVGKRDLAAELVAERRLEAAEESR